MDEALRPDPGGIRRLYELIRDHGPAVEASLAFHQIDLRDWRLPSGGPGKLTTRRLIALVGHLGVDSPLWASLHGEGFTHSQLVAMEPMFPGVVHVRHPASEARGQVAKVDVARERAAAYAQQRAEQERAAQARTHDDDGGQQ